MSIFGHNIPYFVYWTIVNITYLTVIISCTIYIGNKLDIIINILRR